MTFSPKSRQIAWIPVAPNNRRKGIGTALVKYMFKALPENDHFVVNTFLDSDSPGQTAHSFYKSLGFHPEEILEDNYKSNDGHPFQVFRK